MGQRIRPAISVAIANRNYGRFLPRALDSVFRCYNPTRAPIQVVVSDDASTDNSLPIVVFDVNNPSNIRDAVLGRKVGTLVCNEPGTTGE